jgi:hypothetical protein
MTANSVSLLFSTPKGLAVGRLTIAGLTAAIMIAGHSALFVPDYPGAGFAASDFVFLLVDLLGPMLLAVGVRARNTSFICGAAMLVLSAMPWSAVVVTGVNEVPYTIALLGIPVVILTCFICAVIDMAERMSNRRQ